MASLQELVDEDRLRAGLARRFDRERDVRREIGVGMANHHRPPAEHVGRAHQHRVADFPGDAERVGDAARDAAARTRRPSLDEQLVEALAIFGAVDGVGAGAEQLHARLDERDGELERRLPAELHDDTLERSPSCALPRKSRTCLRT